LQRENGEGLYKRSADLAAGNLAWNTAKRKIASSESEELVGRGTNLQLSFSSSKISERTELHLHRARASSSLRGRVG